jgi:hypothetical protein
MIEDAKTAKRALELMEQAHRLLMESLEVVRTNYSDEEYREYRKGMAQVVGHLFFLTMEPIYRQHPTLAPRDTPQKFVEAWSKGKFPGES